MGRHIVLLGEMGVGKTTVGTVVAGMLGWELADSDIAIEAAHGLTGAEIAAGLGVGHLHRLERDALIEALDSESPMVIAAAASVVDHPGTRNRLRVETCVWLTAEPEVISARIEGSTHRRGIGIAERETLTARRDRYRELATIQVDNTSLSPEGTARAIVSRLEVSPGE